MRIEKVVSNLLDASKDKDMKPAKLARIFQLTLRKISETSEAGKEAERIVQSNMLREALNKDLNIRRLRRRKSETSAEVVPMPRRRGPGRPKTSERTVARKSA